MKNIIEIAKNHNYDIITRDSGKLGEGILRFKKLTPLFCAEIIVIANPVEGIKVTHEISIKTDPVTRIADMEKISKEFKELQITRKLISDAILDNMTKVKEENETFLGTTDLSEIGDELPF